jgi:hypothetical protein
MKSISSVEKRRILKTAAAHGVSLAIADYRRLSKHGGCFGFSAPGERITKAISSPPQRYNVIGLAERTLATS